MRESKGPMDSRMVQRIHVWTYGFTYPIRESMGQEVTCRDTWLLIRMNLPIRGGCNLFPKRTSVGRPGGKAVCSDVGRRNNEALVAVNGFVPETPTAISSF
jgi:hypothetical protein